MFQGILPPATIKFSYGEKHIDWRWRKANNNQYYLFINWTTLDCDERKLYMNMLHVMVHVYCNVLNIKDTSRRHSYHNKYWNEEAVKVGLITDHDSEGYHDIDLKESIMKKIQGMFDYEYYYKIYSSIEKNGFQLMQCPRCKRTIYTTAVKDNILLCGYCYCEYIVIR